ncbi:MAG: hypothetical protein JWO15_3367 [Sphingomonadales bacterium]|nr:hypothetical protein [Sphingomonadales bacterium]
MILASTPIVERIARVLAALELSDNAGGSSGSAARDVDHDWPDYADRAIAVLKAMREPDAEMAVAGDPQIWTRMVAAALGKAIPEGNENYVPPEPGTDPMHEGP